MVDRCFLFNKRSVKNRNEALRTIHHHESFSRIFNSMCKCLWRMFTLLLWVLQLYGQRLRSTPEVNARCMHSSENIGKFWIDIFAHACVLCVGMRAYKLRMCTRMSVYVRVYMFIYVSMRLCVAYVCTAIDVCMYTCAGVCVRKTTQKRLELAGIDVFFFFFAIFSAHNVA